MTENIILYDFKSTDILYNNYTLIPLGVIVAASLDTDRAEQTGRTRSA